jgi:hypothetical protein
LILRLDLIGLDFARIGAKDPREILEVPLRNIIIFRVHAMNETLDSKALIANNKSAKLSAVRTRKSH